MSSLPFCSAVAKVCCAATLREADSSWAPATIDKFFNCAASSTELAAPPAALLADPPHLKQHFWLTV